MKKVLLIIFFASFSTVVLAVPVMQSLNYTLQSPPKTENTLALYQYLSVLYNRWNVFQVTNQEPNTNITGSYGQGIVYNDGTHFWLAVETARPEGSTWAGIQLGSV